MAYFERLSQAVMRFTEEGYSVSTPLLMAFIDAINGNTNKTATPGILGKLEGSNLKFDPNDTRQGVRLVQS